MRRINTVTGLFSEGNPAAGQKGSKVTADWLNALQEEVASVVEGAGLELDEAQNDQLLQAILRLSGGMVTRLVEASGPVVAGDSVILVDATDGPVVLTLLSAAAANAKQLTVIKVDDSVNTVTLQAAGEETVCRMAGLDLTVQDDTIHLLPYGPNSNWYKIS